MMIVNQNIFALVEIAFEGTNFVVLQGWKVWLATLALDIAWLLDRSMFNFIQYGLLSVVSETVKVDRYGVQFWLK
ncbi:11566_t:CDS:2, partial [Dentiscutata erythropus]